MIQRINLIEREPFKLTYEKLILAAVVIIVFCIGLFGVQTVRLKMATRETQKISTEIVQLKLKRDSLLKQAATDTQSANITELKAIFEKLPPWSRVMSDISRRLPGSVWLTNFKSITRKEKSIPGIEIKGIARDAAQVSYFLNQLNESPLISKAILVNSQRDTADFTFAIECEIAAKKF